MSAPATSVDFDRAYRATITLWGDPRVPREIKALLSEGSPASALELGCGLGRYARYAAQRGLRVTGIDFSPVAIAKARARGSVDECQPDFRVGDVTRLEGLHGPFDVAFDVGCFHCLGAEAQRAYAKELARLLPPGGRHLVWALDGAPSDVELSPLVVREAFAPYFELQRAEASRRRLVRSHWYWLARSAA